MNNKNAIVKVGIVHELPEDLLQLLQDDSTLLLLWNNLTDIQRNEWICWVTIVKKIETRKEHLQRLQNEIKEGKKRPCCWPGCPHRNKNSRKWFNKY